LTKIDHIKESLKKASGY